MSTYLSPAKINWFLHITGRRDDGYHLLETVFQKISWYDSLDITPRTDGAIHLIGDLSGVAEQKNLAYRAAVALKAFAHNELCGADIVLSKNIPTGAGLGGGSSNAGTVLKVLNELWGIHLPNLELQKIGLTLGADVPFFVSEFNSAFASGIGETLTPMTLPQRPILLLKPSVHVATAGVFTHPNLTRNHPKIELNTTQLDNALSHISPTAPYDNDLESATFAISPEVKTAYETLRQITPHAWVRMSGSGATVFAAPTTPQGQHSLEQWQQHAPAELNAHWVQTL